MGDIEPASRDIGLRAGGPRSQFDGGNGHLAKDFEVTIASDQAILQTAAVIVYLRRIARRT